MSLPLRQTEQHLAETVGIDTWDDARALAALVAGQERAVAAVRAATPAIAAAAGLIAQSLKSGGRLIYAGAGASISIAVQDGSELPGTYGIPEDRILFLIAGGRNAIFDILAAAEDDESAGERDALVCRAGDVLVAVTASGETPYTLSAARTARKLGCKVIGIANNPDSTLERLSDVAIVLASGPEVIVGSTRMGAGTAQKAALNLLSTLANIKLGAVHDGYMVNLRADNAKLRTRAETIVMSITGADRAAAGRALGTANGEIKPAALLCAGARDVSVARYLLAATQGNLRLAMARLPGP